MKKKRKKKHKNEAKVNNRMPFHKTNRNYFWFTNPILMQKHSIAISRYARSFSIYAIYWPLKEPFITIIWFCDFFLWIFLCLSFSAFERSVCPLLFHNAIGFLSLLDFLSLLLVWNRFWSFLICGIYMLPIKCKMVQCLLNWKINKSIIFCTN